MQAEDLISTNIRKREFNAQRIQTASDMEAAMLVVALVALGGAVFALLSFGLLAGLALSILSAIAFALSKLFDLMGDLFGARDRRETGSQSQLETQLSQ